MLGNISRKHSSLESKYIINSFYFINTMTYNLNPIFKSVVSLFKLNFYILEINTLSLDSMWVLDFAFNFASREHMYLGNDF